MTSIPALEWARVGGGGTRLAWFGFGARCGRRQLLLLALAALLLPFAAPRASDLPPELLAQLTAELDARRFSGVLDVREGERTAWSHVAGSARSAESVFWIGSVSKQFAAVAAARLVDEGKLAFDAPVAAELGLRPGALQKDGIACTLAHVLNHTCGLPSGNVCALNGLDEPRTERRFLDCVAALELESTPGTEFAYANVGYSLVGVLVARTAGVPYGTFLREAFFAPLGMQSTGVDLRADPAASRRLVQGRFFNGFGWSGSWPWLLLDPMGPGTHGASGNVYSTAADLHAWNRALHGGKLLTPATYTRLVTPALKSYASGVVVAKAKDGTRWLWHNGSIAPMGWSAFLAYVPERDVSVVGLANRSHTTSHVEAAARSLVRGALGEPVGTPILRDPEPAAYIEPVFFVLPLLLAASVAWLVVLAVRGPRGDPVHWYGRLLTGGALYLLAVSLFDFYDRARLLSPIPIAAVAIALLVHRRRCTWAFRQAWAERGTRRVMLSHALTVAVVAVVAPPATRVWLGAFVLVEGVLLYGLAGARSSRAAAAPSSTRE